MADAGIDRDQGSSSTYYWNVDIPGLTEVQAGSLVTSLPGLPGSTIDPRQWFTVHMDRETAKVLRLALLGLGRDGIGVGLRESVDDWLISTGFEVDDE